MFSNTQGSYHNLLPEEVYPEDDGEVFIPLNGRGPFDDDTSSDEEEEYPEHDGQVCIYTGGWGHVHGEDSSDDEQPVEDIEDIVKRDFEERKKRCCAMKAVAKPIFSLSDFFLGLTLGSSLHEYEKLGMQGMQHYMEGGIEGKSLLESTAQLPKESGRALFRETATLSSAPVKGLLLSGEIFGDKENHKKALDDLDKVEAQAFDAVINPGSKTFAERVGAVSLLANESHDLRVEGQSVFLFLKMLSEGLDHFYDYCWENAGHVHQDFCYSIDPSFPDDSSAGSNFQEEKKSPLRASISALGALALDQQDRRFMRLWRPEPWQEPPVSLSNLSWSETGFSTAYSPQGYSFRWNNSHGLSQRDHITEDSCFFLMSDSPRRGGWSGCDQADLFSTRRAPIRRYEPPVQQQKMNGSQSGCYTSLFPTTYEQYSLYSGGESFGVSWSDKLFQASQYVLSTDRARQNGRANGGLHRETRTSPGGMNLRNMGSSDSRLPRENDQPFREFSLVGSSSFFDSSSSSNSMQPSQTAHSLAGQLAVQLGNTEETSVHQRYLDNMPSQFTSGSSSSRHEHPAVRISREWREGNKRRSEMQQQRQSAHLRPDLRGSSTTDEPDRTISVNVNINFPSSFSNSSSEISSDSKADHHSDDRSSSPVQGPVCPSGHFYKNGRQSEAAYGAARTANSLKIMDQL